MTETPLPGGLVNPVVRIGDTVRRPAPDRAEFVHRLLGLLADRGFEGAPRLLGVDGQGREILTYLPGHVAWQADQPAAVTADGSLARLAELVRQLHDLTAGTALAHGGEVVCHNDLAPRNTVYRPVAGALRPVALLDWDLAAPGRRIDDVAHVCWQFLGLGPSVTDLTEVTRRIAVICDAYGLRHRDRLIETILWWQDRCWRGIERGAQAGQPGARRLRETGAVEEVRAARRWVAAHRDRLQAGLVGRRPARGQRHGAAPAGPGG